MYRKPTGQLDFENFAMSFGGKLRRDNRWVILSEIIPWGEFEKRYAEKFKSKTGNPALPVRVALGSLIIKEKLKLTDEDTVLSIQESHYLQYFIGYASYSDEKPFDASLMVHFRKRLGASILGEVNELIIARNQKKDDDTKTPDDQPSAEPEKPNKGQLIVDATCAPQDIRFLRRCWVTQRGTRKA